LSVFERLGRWCAGHPWPVVIVWAILFAVSAPALLHLAGVLKVGGFSNDTTESARARAELQTRLGYSANELLVVVSSPTLRPNDDTFINQVHSALADVAKEPEIRQVVWHTDNFRQVGRDGHTAYELLVLDPSVDAGPAIVAAVQARLHPTSLHVLLGGAAAFYSDIEAVSSDDLHRAELIAFPFAAIALVLVFRSLVAALVPVVVGGVGVTVATALIFLLAHVTDMSIFVMNVATMIGLGLGVDYSLFITSRFREELATGYQEINRDSQQPVGVNCHPERSEGPLAGQASRLAGLRSADATPGVLRCAQDDYAGAPGLQVAPSAIPREAVRAAIVRTAGTAGRSVCFSGLTVCLGLLALLGFDFMLLRSVGIGGCLVVVCTVLAALTLLPALLSLLGPRIDAFQVLPKSRGVTLFWDRLARVVMRRPLAIGVPALALLLLLGAPFLHVRLSSPDASILPKSVPSRKAFDVLNAQFATGDTAPIMVAIRVPGEALDSANLDKLFDFTHAIARDQRVARIDSIVTIDPRITKAQYHLLYADPTRIPDYWAATLLSSTVKGDTVLVQVDSKYPSTSPESQGLVQSIRQMSLGSGASILVDGEAAEIHDVVQQLYHDFPRALLFIVLTTYSVLFFLFRSVVLPLKAIMMNTLSIVASYGALVFVFQDGHLSGLLGFSPLGYVEATLPILMFCTLFGLSMDYEVFLLSRIKEAYEASGDNQSSVAEGMRRSGRIITSAALIVILVSSSFMAAGIILIKALGLGVALAVLLDATVVRALLVPATMRLLGRWNWWLPTALAGRLAIPARPAVRRSEG